MSSTYRARLLAFRDNYFPADLHLYFEELSIVEGIATRTMGTAIKTEKVAEGMSGLPLLSLKENQAQELMDSLYRAGLRPSDAPKTGEALNPTLRHLADLRAMVEKAYKVKLP